MDGGVIMIRKFISISLMTFLCLFSIIPVEGKTSETNHTSEKMSVVGRIGAREEAIVDDHLVIEVKVPDKENLSKEVSLDKKLPKLGFISETSFLIAGLLLIIALLFLVFPRKQQD
jgi:hypothetical protein